MQKQLLEWLSDDSAVQPCRILPPAPALPHTLCAHTALLALIPPHKPSCCSKPRIAALPFTRWEDAVIWSHPFDPNLPSRALWIFNCRLAVLEVSDGLETHRTQLQVSRRFPAHSMEIEAAPECSELHRMFNRRGKRTTRNIIKKRTNKNQTETPPFLPVQKLKAKWPCSQVTKC